ncbi:unnamed protein product [Linum tenue]|uniref:Ferredoxin thioredoxin reductase alpha chain domain-containing protein n=1 Tax=Linum tenue TaxID=586396 RepID=A0AAV0K3Z4_9ROSI|nr:unnamed protein product [Linum tenue]
MSCSCATPAAAIGLLSSPRPSATRLPSSLALPRSSSPALTTAARWRKQQHQRRQPVCCEVAVRSSNDSATSSEHRIGAKVRVTAPLKVYHVPRVPEVDLTGKEGVLKQYVGLWKEKTISANLPYKVEFLLDVEGRSSPVKFSAHLRDDEFEYLD